MEITAVMQAAVAAVAVEVGWWRWWQRRQGVVVTSHGNRHGYAAVVSPVVCGRHR